MKVIQWMCVTLNSKVNRQGHGIVFNIFDILDLENVRIDTKINFVSFLQPEIWKVMQKGVWPWFSRSCNKDRIFSLSPLDSLTPKTYPWEIFLKNSDGKTKIQGVVVPTPLGRPKVDFYLGHLRVNFVQNVTFHVLYCIRFFLLWCVYVSLINVDLKLRFGKTGGRTCDGRLMEELDLIIFLFLVEECRIKVFDWRKSEL